MASSYDTFGKALLKASCLMDVDGISDTTVSLCESLHTLGVQSRRVADFYKKQIVAPLDSKLSTHRTTLDSLGHKCVAARSQCFETRKRALRAKSKYMRTARLAENEFYVWKRAIQKTGALVAEAPPKTNIPLDDTSSIPTWERSIRQYGGKGALTETEALIAKLHAVVSAQTRYQELVENENDSVAYAQKMESEALDVLEDVETSRILYFAQSVIEPLCTSAYEKINLLPGKAFETGESGSLDLKKGKDLLSNIFQRQTTTYEEGSARVEAGSLGIPMDCPSLRDDVKREVTEIEAQIKIAHILNEVLEALATAFLGLEEGLMVNCSLTSTERLEVMALVALGPNAAQVWGDIVKLFEDEGVVVREMALSIENLRVEKIEGLLESAQRDIRTENENDDRNWKTLCESARLETKAAARYRNVQVLREKARERMVAVDAPDKEDEEARYITRNPQKNRVTKALFAGGEAMKKLQENARVAMAKNQLNEADQNAAKEQQALDDASRLKEQAISDYKRVTENRIETLRKIKSQMKLDFANISTTLIEKTKLLETARKHNTKAKVPVGSLLVETLMDDLNAWRTTSRDKVLASRQNVEGSDDGNLSVQDEGYKMAAVMSGSELIQSIFNLMEYANPPPDFIGNLEEGPHEDDSVIRPDSSFDSNASISVQSEGEEESSHCAEECTTVPPSASQVPVSTSSETTKDIKHETTIGEDPTARHKDDFLRHFWRDKSKESLPPPILQTISCTYRPKEKGGFRIPAIPGRVYTTRDSMYFLSVDGKQLVLPWGKM